MLTRDLANTYFVFYWRYQEFSIVHSIQTSIELRSKARGEEEDMEIVQEYKM